MLKKCKDCEYHFILNRRHYCKIGIEYIGGHSRYIKSSELRPSPMWCPERKKYYFWGGEVCRMEKGKITKIRAKRSV